MIFTLFYLFIKRLHFCPLIKLLCMFFSTSAKLLPKKVYKNLVVMDGIQVQEQRNIWCRSYLQRCYYIPNNILQYRNIGIIYQYIWKQDKKFENWFLHPFFDIDILFLFFRIDCACSFILKDKNKSENRKGVKKI